MSDRPAVLGYFRRDSLRVALVIAVAVFAMAETLPTLLPFIGVPMYGDFGFTVVDNRVTTSSSDAARSGIHAGDTIDFRAMPFGAAYYFQDARWPAIGARETFHVIHDGVARDVTRISESHPSGWDLFILVELSIKKLATLMLAIVGVALVLVRPTRLSLGFYVFAIGANTAPYFWSFLPLSWYLALFAAGLVFQTVAAAGFVTVALRLGNQASTGWRRALDRAVPYLAIVTSVCANLYLIAIGMGLGREHLFIAVEIASFNAGFVLGGLALGETFLNRKLSLKPGARRAIGAFVIVALVVNVENITQLWRFTENIQNTDISASLWADVMDVVQIVAILLSLIVAYMLIRYRVVDVRFVINRSLRYGAVAIAIVVAFMGFHFAFARQASQIAFAFPLELLVAIVLGYRLSGFADVAKALALADVEGPRAGLRGRRAEEREILARALGRAERTGRASLIAEVRGQSTFAAFLAGEDDEFKRQAGKLDEAVAGHDLRGLGLFASAATGRLSKRETTSTDLNDWVARAYLVACGTSDDASEARRYAGDAVAAADASGVPFLRALARAALAEFSPTERADLYAAAAEFAEQTASPELRQAIDALQRGRGDLGLLEPFIECRLRAPRAANPVLEVSFVNATARSYGKGVSLRESERALIFAIAHDPAPTSSEQLADMLWPDLDGDAAANAFRVCLHRLRRGMGDPQSVVRSQRGYQLRPGSVVDLWAIGATIREVTSKATLTEADCVRLARLHADVRRGRSVRTAQSEWFAPYALKLERLSREAALKLARDAMKRGDRDEALRLARIMIEDDPSDRFAAELIESEQRAGPPFGMRARPSTSSG